MDSEKYKAEVQKEAMEANALQITHTPTIVVAKRTNDMLDGMVILGAQPLVTFQSANDALLRD